VADDLVFIVEDAKASLLTKVSLADAGLKERQHLQEWVRKNPAILGDGITVVTFEFDKWVHGGIDVSDRLDILALENTGRLVVVELKRGKAPDTTDMQAIKYAAMASNFTLEALAEHYAAYLTKFEEAEVSTEAAKQRLDQHISNDETETFTLLLEQPRIILIANDFPPSVTSTAVFLSKFGLDITLIKFQTYKTPSSGFILTLNRIFPIKGVESFQIQPRISEEIEKSANERRQKNAVFRIIEAHAIPEGNELTLVLPEIWVQRLKDYLDSDDTLSKAKWDKNNRINPLFWEYDQKNYSPTGLCKHIIEMAGQIANMPRGIQGTSWWKNKDGKTLWQIAEEI
jgi:hypothetical protein